MKIAILNSYDMRGGAARAAYRLHKGLRAAGQDSQMVVQLKSGHDADVSGPEGVAGRLAAYLRPALDLFPIVRYWHQKQAVFYPGWLSGGILPRAVALKPDVVHMHWISGGAVNLRGLRQMATPVAWTLHDMWGFTGGCHYDNGCGKFHGVCGACPVLESSRPHDPAYAGWKRKEGAYRDLSIVLVSPSHWLGRLARSSALMGRYPVHVIPNGIDTSVFRPMPKVPARARFGLPTTGKLILFGAANAAKDSRKGISFLEEALRILAAQSPRLNAAAAIFGAPAPKGPPRIGMKVFYPGIVRNDHHLAELYSAADVFVAPSLQENLSNTVMEALACGTPCAAFDLGGMPDMIEHRANGYLSHPGDVDDLAAGIRWILEEEHRRQSLAEHGLRKVIKSFDLNVVVAKHVSLYESMRESAMLLGGRANA